MPSAALRETTRPDVVCVSSLVVALVTEGVSATGLTVMVAVTTLPPSPPSLLLSDACTWKLAVPKKFAEGVNFSPAFPWAKVMKPPLLICVVPSFWNSVPLVMFVILKCVTSVPSAAFRETTSPEVDCVSSLVVAFVTDGVSATGLTVICAVAAAPKPAPPLLSRARHVEVNVLAGEYRLAAGVNLSPALPSAKVMKSPSLIGVVPSFWNRVPLVMFGDLEVRHLAAVGGVA